MANKNLILRKLTSPYIGNLADITKLSVLTHSDVDNNFIFLKGEDIITGSTSGTSIVLTQVNTDIIEIDLSPILCTQDNFTTGATLNSSSLVFDTKDALSAYTVDLSSITGDTNTDNFTTGVTLNGTTLYYNRTNALSAYTVDLSSITGDTNTDNFTTGSTVIGSTAFFDRTDALSAFTLDLSAFTADTNYYTTGATIIGNTAFFDRNDTLSAFTLDVSSLTANTDTNDYTTGTTLVGSTIYYDRTDTLSAFTTDLSGIIPLTDYGNIIFVSEVGPTGQTRADVVGDINKPVDIEWASSIAQSGDTIHVKAGIYNITTTAGNGLSVDGVNHYFEEKAKVYKTTTGTIFSTGGLFGPLLAQGNVYGNGSFYASGLPGSVFEGTTSSPSTRFSSTIVFEFDECTNTSGTCINFQYANMGDTIIRGKNRLVSTGGSAFYSANSTAAITLIDCPNIIGDIRIGQSGGSGGDTIIKSTTIDGTIIYVGGSGKLSCDSKYIKKVAVISIGPTKYVDIKCMRIDEAELQGNIVNIDGHVGKLTLGDFSTADIKLCDEFSINNAISPDSIANITMSNVTGATNTIINYGVVNLRQVNLINANATEYPTGPKSYDINGSFQKVNLLGRWANSDTITHRGTSLSILSIDSNAYIRDTTINVYSEKLEILGKTYDCDINLTGGTIVMNGATMLVSDQNKEIINSPISGSTVKVYSGGLNTNKIGPLTGSTEMLKVTVAGINAALTVNGETFTSTTGVTAAASAAELVSLINASVPLAASASQDTPGVDTYIYVEADVIATALTMAYGFNTVLNSQIRTPYYSLTDTVGGQIIEDIDID